MENIKQNKVAFCGIAGCGKDTIAKYLISELNYTRVAFADALRDICASLYPELKEYNSDELKDIIIPKYGMSAREIWIKVSKTLRDIDDDIWISKTSQKLQTIDTNIIVTDCRTFKEFEMLKTSGFKIIWVDNVLNKKPINEYDKQNTMKLQTLCDKVYETSTLTGYKDVSIISKLLK